MVTRDQMRGGAAPKLPEPVGPVAAEPADFDDDASPAKAASADDDLPDHTQEDPATGDWIYTIQRPFASAGRESELLPDKLRIAKRLYARDIRALGAAENGPDQVFRLMCSMTKLQPSVAERLDAEDYNRLAILIRLRAEGNV